MLLAISQNLQHDLTFIWLYLASGRLNQPTDLAYMPKYFGKEPVNARKSVGFQSFRDATSSLCQFNKGRPYLQPQSPGGRMSHRLQGKGLVSHPSLGAPEIYKIGMETMPLNLAQ